MHAILQLIIRYRYAILFPLACFEGPVVSFFVGMLVALGYFNPFAAYVILVFGDVIPDTAYYFLGRYGKRKTLIARYASKIGITEERFDVVRRLWSRHGGKTMFFSKLAYGLSTPFLISSGLAGLPFRKFLLYALPVTFAQYAVLLTLGYYFGASSGLVLGSFRDVQVIVAAVIVFAVAYYFLSAYIRKKLLLEEREEENEV